MRIAQVLGGRAHWIFEADAMPEFAPDIVLMDITGRDPAPQEGWLFDGTNFRPPPAPPLQPIPPWAFMDLFSDAEFEAIETFARTNAKAAVFLRRLVGRPLVSSSDAKIIAAMAALVTAGILTAPRRDEILASFG